MARDCGLRAPLLFPFHRVASEVSDHGLLSVLVWEILGPHEVVTITERSYIGQGPISRDVVSFRYLTGLWVLFGDIRSATCLARR